MLQLGQRVKLLVTWALKREGNGAVLDVLWGFGLWIIIL